jgi:hypothetical protein
MALLYPMEADHAPQRVCARAGVLAQVAEVDLRRASARAALLGHTIAGWRRSSAGGLQGLGAQACAQRSDPSGRPGNSCSYCTPTSHDTLTATVRIARMLMVTYM